MSMFFICYFIAPDKTFQAFFNNAHKENISQRNNGRWKITSCPRKFSITVQGAVHAPTPKQQRWHGLPACCSQCAYDAQCTQFLKRYFYVFFQCTYYILGFYEITVATMVTLISSIRKIKLRLLLWFWNEIYLAVGKFWGTSQAGN